jgi:membrane-associated phospholipid phosphatase
MSGLALSAMAVSQARPRWALTSAWRRAHDGFRDVDRRLLRTFLAWLALGLVIACAATAAFTFGASRLDAAGAFAWERGTLLAIEHDFPMSFQHALFLQTFGTSAMLFPIALAGAWLAARARRPFEAIALLAAAFAIKLVVFAGWMMWARDRPDFIAHGLAVPTSLRSFPSGHLAQTVVVYGLLASFVCRMSKSAVERTLAVMLTVLLAATVGLARVRMGAHWPTDLVGGAFAGVAWLAAILVALRRVSTVRTA